MSDQRNERKFFLPVLAILIFFSLSADDKIPAAPQTEMYPQIGHSARVNSVKFSADGKYALSGSDDNTMKSWDVASGKEIRTFNGHSKSVLSVAFSPDGRWALSGSMDKSIKLWEIATGQELRTFTGHTCNVGTVCFSPDGKFILSGSFGSNDNHARLWNAETGEEVRAFAQNDHMYAVDFSPDGKQIACAANDFRKNYIILMETATGKTIGSWGGNNQQITSVCFSPDGKLILSASEDRIIRLWDAQTFALVRSFSGHVKMVTSAVFTPDGRHILSGSWDSTLKLWKTDTGEMEASYFYEDYSFSSICLSPDGAYLLGGGGYCTTAGCTNPLKFIEVKTGDELTKFRSNSMKLETLCVSNDGSLAVCGGINMITLWDMKKMTIARILKTDSGGVYDAAFSPDDKHLVTGHAGGTQFVTVRLWDVQSGKELLSLKGHSSYVKSVCFSPDGKYFASGGGLPDNTVMLWESDTGALLKKLTGHTNTITSLSFTPDGGTLISGSEDGAIKYWAVKTGDLIRTLQNTMLDVHSAVFSPDEKTICVCGTIGDIPDVSGRLFVIDAVSGKLLRTFTGHTNSLSCVSYSPDGNRLLSGSWDHTFILWDASTGKEIRTFRGHAEGVMSVNFSPDGKYAVSGARDTLIKLWDIATGREIRTMTGHREAVMSVCFSRDGKHIISGSLDQTIRLWETNTGREIRSISGHSSGVTSVCFSPDGKYILSGSYDNTIRLWDMNSGKEIRIAKGHGSTVTSVCFSPDGKQILSGGWDHTVRLWDAATGRETARYEGHFGWVNSACFSKDSRFILSAADDDSLRIWDMVKGKTVNIHRFFNSLITSVCVSPDGRDLISGGWTFSTDSELVLRGLDDGIKRGVFIGHREGVNAVCFSRDGRYVLSGGSDRTVRLWEKETREESKRFTAHTDDVSDVAFSPDGKYILSGGRDNTVRIWNVAAGEWIAFMSNQDGSEWLIYTHDGYWDSSPNGGDLVAMVRGLEVWNIDQFAIRNNRPDIILERLGSTNRELIEHYRQQYRKRLRKLGLTEAGLSVDYQVPEAKIIEAKPGGKFVTLAFTLADGKYNLKSYNVFVNDVPLFGSYGKPVAGKSRSVAEKIELTSGDNKIEVSCLNEKGAESFRALAYAKYDQAVKGDLYFIGFGVSDYKHPGVNDLSFGHKDAKDLGSLFEGMKGGFKEVHIHTFVNEEVSAANIRKAKALLKDAKVDDTFVLFISGHGIHDRDKEATYYYVTHETDPNDLSRTAAEFELVEELLQGVAPRNKLFLMDTCESGEVDEAAAGEYLAAAGGKGMRARTMAGPKGLQVTAKGPKRTYLFEKDRYIYNDLARRSGAIVFSSSRGGEFSFEDDRLRNGYFTAVLKQALTTKAADRNNDGAVSVDELREYVSREVAAQTADERHPEGIQHPTVDRDNIHRKFAFPLPGAGK